MNNHQGVDFKIKNIPIEEVIVKMQIWDTTGQERFRSMAKNFFRGAVGAFFVVDVTDITSYEVTKGWINQCTQHGHERIEKIILANKVDLEENRIISTDEISKLATENGARYYEVSAKTGKNIKEAFEAMALTVKMRFYVEPSEKEENDKKGILLSKNKSTPYVRKKGCCEK